ncbi:MAG: DUF1049 domain-containing protein [Hyphomicrobiales bacterium]|nr:DUF1049 domain-containing protein [Hyphomicrobiales bacterium]MDE2113570.1 LapA family protein [Hyphomicrobiales bacterium]
MKAFLKLVLMLVVGVPVIALALANREMVNLSFDPFAGAAHAGGFAMPLFLVILLAVALGVLIGGISTWLGQSKHRRGARQARAEAEQLRGAAAAPVSQSLTTTTP